ncbi:DNA polymerase III subunit alpha [Vagococcus silagei]|uniref:DNA polymerase III subunit alpha n=1 Tax=Vagococcus silagei TaxID=2508885 RepID=A0A4S3B6S5_9ENTE|nr:DNA polymerase III subunit alpha [Vagococcus silagei]THB61650.1 DNA polymerase III subunit alpha [Vagococcus silagei]
MLLGQLQLLTSYSLLQSTNRIEELVKKSQQHGFSTLAITDLNTMSGVLDFEKTCLKYDIKPIIGVTIDFVSSVIEGKNYQIVLLAKNLDGYQNLLKIVTLYFEKARTLELSDVKPLLADVIAIIPWENSEWLNLTTVYNSEESRNIWQETYQESLKSIDVYHSLPHTDSQFSEEEEQIKSLPFKKIATHPVKYLKTEDYFNYKVLRHIDSGQTMNVYHLKEKQGPEYFKTSEEIFTFFKERDLEEALRNNEIVSESCQVEIPKHQTLLPKYQTPHDEVAVDFLKMLSEEGLRKRGLAFHPDYAARLNYELSVIHQMGYDDYFLIVWDVMKYARDENIITACRGSAAGSLVSYCLEITQVDPIEYDLLFERFLNPERFTMPDIDIDIPDNKREYILNYVHQKYGNRRVAQIATFGTLAAKQALRDVCRVFGLSQAESNKWSQSIPNVLKITLSDALKQSNNLQKLVEFSDRNRLIFETALKLEGLPRHMSTHAAGVVIGDHDLTNEVPLQTGSGEIPLTQFTMGDVEKVGLLKMDFLGLRNLTIINQTLENINYSQKEKLTLTDIPLDDTHTLALFRDGLTDGIFQFESPGIKKVLKKLQPTSIEDITSVNALYRPGPMQNIDLFIERKNGQAPIDYLTPDLQPILEKTYGVIVYQEQVMKIVSLMAGYSLSQADILRRAISKKDKAIIDEERQHFVQGAISNGYTNKISENVYTYIEKFANYGFNRSHAVVYSVLAYQMAYLKVHYPLAFFASLLHSVQHSQAKTVEYFNEARQQQIAILPPSINDSQYGFISHKGKILMGFSSIKGVRRDLIRQIIDERKQSGSFSSLENLLIRLDKKWLKEEYILPLIYSGAFDRLHGNRRQLVIDLSSLIQNIQYSGGSIDLLGFLSLKGDKVSDFSEEEKLEQEVEFLGTYVSSHPTERYKKQRSFYNIKLCHEVITNEKVQMLLYITDSKKIRTKKGESMLFLNGSDHTGNIELTIFPKLYRELNFNLPEKIVYYVEGRIEYSQYSRKNQLIVTKIVPADTLAEARDTVKCFIKIPAEMNTPLILAKLKQLFQENQGEHPVILFFADTKQKMMLDSKFWVSQTEELTQAIAKLLGEDSIVFQ